MAQDSENAQAFARRLVALMKAKELTSDRSRSGVDVTALGKAVGVSYEMARRYVEGQAMPRPDTAEAIAHWLGVPASALVWGEPVEPGGIDPLLLEQVLQNVISAQQLAGVSLSTVEAARVVAQLYIEARQGGSIPPATLAAMIKALSRK